MATSGLLGGGDDGVENAEDVIDGGDVAGGGGDEGAVGDADNNDVPVITSVWSYIEDDDDVPIITSVYSCT